MSALPRLVRIMGPERGTATYQEVLREAKLQDISSAGDLLLFAKSLMARGGVLEAVGRSLKIQALLDGAKDLDAAADRGSSSPSLSAPAKSRPR